jgi:hypothetical protein
MYAGLRRKFYTYSTEALSVSRRIAMCQVADSRHGHPQEM